MDTETAEALATIAKTLLNDSRRFAGSDRLLMALTVETALTQPDPLKFLHRVRARALDTMPIEDSQGGLTEMRQHTESLLDRIENAVTKGPGPV
jgi:hypothetical protein